MTKLEGAALLLEELRAYRPADELELREVRAVEALLAHGPEPFSRRSFDPGHVTASCFIIDPAAGRLLLHYHRRLRRWLQMGGHLEEGESPLEAALREGAEESGLPDLEPIDRNIFDVHVHPIPAAKNEPAHRHFDVRYLARTDRPDRIAIDRSESEELEWVDLERAVSMMNAAESTRVVRKIEKLLWPS